MDLMKMATDLFLQKLGSSAGNLNSDVVASALSALLGGENGQLDLGALVAKFSQGDLASLAQSWLGDGANANFSIDQVLSVLGASQVSEFSAGLGIEESDASSALSEMIPELIDQNSSAGGLLDAVGGVGGLAGMASKLFR